MKIASVKYDKDGYIWALYVNPKYRNMGIGSGLINYIKAKTTKPLSLWSNDDNINFYQRLGFNKTEMVTYTDDKYTLLRYR